MAHITLFKLGTEPEEFAAFLRGKGHSVTFHMTDDTLIDGVSAFSNDEAREEINDLWEAYGRS